MKKETEDLQSLAESVKPYFTIWSGPEAECVIMWREISGQGEWNRVAYNGGFVVELYND